MPSSTEKQARFMAWIAHTPGAAKKAGVPKSVATEFNQADTGSKLLSKAMRKFAGGHVDGMETEDGYGDKPKYGPDLESEDGAPNLEDGYHYCPHCGAGHMPDAFDDEDDGGNEGLRDLDGPDKEEYEEDGDGDGYAHGGVVRRSFASAIKHGRY